jgi:hypothetical protein
MIVLIAAGLFFYWLRIRCLVLYGLSEILFALLLMFLWCWPYRPAFLLIGGYSWPLSLVAWFVAVYAFVRGCDNFVTGARSARDF